MNALFPISLSVVGTVTFFNCALKKEYSSNMFRPSFIMIEVRDSKLKNAPVFTSLIVAGNVSVLTPSCPASICVMWRLN